MVIIIKALPEYLPMLDDLSIFSEVEEEMKLSRYEQASDVCLRIQYVRHQEKTERQEQQQMLDFDEMWTSPLRGGQSKPPSLEGGFFTCFSAEPIIPMEW